VAGDQVDRRRLENLLHDPSGTLDDRRARAKRLEALSGPAHDRRARDLGLACKRPEFLFLAKPIVRAAGIVGGEDVGANGASGESQLIHGARSSFMTKLPLRWLSKGPLNSVASSRAFRELPANTQPELSPTVR